MADTGLVAEQRDDLDQLLEAANAADPGVRIQFRDPIAAHGASAIPPLRGWLADARLSAFALRTLEKIAVDPSNRRAVLEALGSVDSRAVGEWASRDVADAVARIQGKVPPSGGAGGHARGKPAEEWPGSRVVSPLELQFHDAMLDVFRLAGEATRRTRSDGTIARGYWASYFLRGIRNNGGADYAHQLLRKGTTDGFQRLKEEGRLDLTMEALVLKPEYGELFTDEERKVAAHRLAEAGYHPSKAPRPS
jgi:hypothetical protein